MQLYGPDGYLVTIARILKRDASYGLWSVIFHSVMQEMRLRPLSLKFTGNWAANNNFAYNRLQHWCEEYRNDQHKKKFRRCLNWIEGGRNNLGHAYFGLKYTNNLARNEYRDANRVINARLEILEAIQPVSYWREHQEKFQPSLSKIAEGHNYAYFRLHLFLRPIDRFPEEDCNLLYWSEEYRKERRQVSVIHELEHCEKMLCTLALICSPRKKPLKKIDHFHAALREEHRLLFWAIEYRKEQLFDFARSDYAYKGIFGIRPKEFFAWHQRISDSHLAIVDRGKMSSNSSWLTLMVSNCERLRFWRREYRNERRSKSVKLSRDHWFARCMCLIEYRRDKYLMKQSSLTHLAIEDAIRFRKFLESEDEHHNLNLFAQCAQEAAEKATRQTFCLDRDERINHRQYRMMAYNYRREICDLYPWELPLASQSLVGIEKLKK